MTNMMKKNTLLQACIDNNNVDLFKEIRKMRNLTPTIASTIDGKCEDIPNHFAGIYKDLYNSVNDKDDLLNVHHMLDRIIDSNSVDEVLRITPTVIADAVQQLKDNKSDPIFEFSCDCHKNAPLIFYEQPAALFRTFLIHMYELYTNVSHSGAYIEE